MKWFEKFIINSCSLSHESDDKNNNKKISKSLTQEYPSQSNVEKIVKNSRFFTK
jgi:hypothetical protein